MDKGLIMILSITVVLMIVYAFTLFTLHKNIRKRIFVYKDHEYIIVGFGKLKNPEIGGWEPCVYYRSIDSDTDRKTVYARVEDEFFDLFKQI